MSQQHQSDNYSWVELQRDPAAFEQFFKSTVAGLCAYSWRIVKDRQAAEDIVQEFFSRFWQQRAGLQIQVSPRRYAFRAVHNASLNYLRDNKLVSEDHLLEELPADEDPVERELLLQDRVRQLGQAIAALPPQCRIVFEKVCLEQRKYKEVAEELGISVFTVRNQVSKAYEILRNNIILALISLIVLCLLGR
ncbi:RNA polymerase sigma-70 factor (ECF subfamily) [Chitinophaga dinghuensis]|uniref:RNA polymerase sigma-70 factor (ECF subfamily) n=1 Tax=Chitinophaga dinghuensis TaxID=1539050 RepID=A0A327WIK2_9BACT|nr:RNA polymerase sigma-70 factor [Chitinophaga dinghuensis]RAJ87594.1 RNA polymerase sigma-70 factor (ECF subfamily) [Chitinophaga dinghuensis]